MSKSTKLKPTLIIIGLVSAVLVFYLIFVKIKNKSVEVFPVQSVDLASHSLYKTYKFSADKKVIDFGEQPLWAPTSLITTLMKRDRILQRQLVEVGYELKMHAFLKGEDVNYFFKTGDLEAGVVGDEPTLRVVAGGQARVVAMMQKGFLSIISRDILEVSRLSDKKIGYSFGSNAHFYLLKILKENNIKLSEVKLIPMDVVAMPDALANGQIDGFVAWEPTPTIAINKYPAFKTTSRGRSYGFLYVSKELAEKQPEAVKILLAAEMRALNWLREDNSNLLQASKWSLENSLKLDPQSSYLSPEQLVEIAQDDLPGVYIEEYPKIEAKLLEKDGDLHYEFDYLQNLNLIPKNVKWEEEKKSFDQELMNEVIKEIDRYGVFEYEY